MIAWRPRRGDTALLLTIFVLSGCGAATLVGSASPSIAMTSAPVVSPSRASTEAPTPTASAPRTARPSALVLPSFDLPDGATPDIVVSPYLIEGETAAELASAMRLQRLKDAVGDAVFALTTWDIIWKYDYVDRPGGKCGLGNLSVSVDVNTIVPRWNRPTAADAELVARWERFLDALAVHELRHIQNGLDRAGEIADALASLEAQPTCAALETVADAAGAALIELGNAWDIDYDTDTRHGATQGATFP